MMRDSDLLFGWSFQQYLVAATWLHRQGHNIHWAPATTIQHVQCMWDKHFNDAPLTGAMQVYQPEIDEDVRMHIVIAWVHLAAREMRYRHDSDVVNPMWRSPV